MGREVKEQRGKEWYDREKPETGGSLKKRQRMRE